MGKVRSKQNEIKEVEREQEKVINMIYIVFIMNLMQGSNNLNNTFP